MARPDSRPSRWLTALSLGLFGSLFAACTVQEPAEPAQPPEAQASPAPEVKIPVMSQVRSYGLDPDWPVPSDFPVMLGCSDEEIVHPDPLAEAQSRKICEAGQLGLYQLSEDTSLSAEDQQSLAMEMMGAILERLSAAREVTEPEPTDGGTDPTPGDGGMP
jgi:hypothetical protein